MHPAQLTQCVDKAAVHVAPSDRNVVVVGACNVVVVASTPAAIRMQGTELPIFGEVPVQAIQALPYVLTVVLLAGFIGKAVAPAAIGKPYVKEH